MTVPLSKNESVCSRVEAGEELEDTVNDCQQVKDISTIKFSYSIMVSTIVHES